MIDWLIVARQRVWGLAVVYIVFVNFLKNYLDGSSVDLLNMLNLL